jgi:hypothetical protein
LLPVTANIAMQAAAPNQPQPSIMSRLRPVRSAIAPTTGMRPTSSSVDAVTV